MATPRLSSFTPGGNATTQTYATLTNGRVHYNTTYIFVRAHAMRRTDAKLIADMTAVGMNGGELDPFRYFLKRAWQDAKCHAGDLEFISRFTAPKRNERDRLETEQLAIHMRTRIGVDGQRRLREITRRLSRLAA